MSRLTFPARATMLAIAIAALGAAPAAAQRAKSFEIAGFYGGYWGSDVYAGQINGAGPLVTVGLNSAGLYGLRLAYNSSRSFGLEFSWSSSDPSMTFTTAFTPTPTGDLKVNNYDFDAMFNFGQQKIWGYFALGLGWSDFSPTVTVTPPPATPPKAQSYFAWNTALGMKVFLNPHIAIRLDGRYRWSETNHYTSTGVSCGYYCYSYASTWFGAGELTGGLSYVAFK